MDRNTRVNEQLELLIRRYPILASVKEDINGVYRILEECFLDGNMLLVAGNGGSCADSEHMVGELMKGFCKKRPVPEDFARALQEIDPERGKILAAGLQGALPAIALTGHPGLSTAFLNDVDGELIYAQQVYGYGKTGDVFLGISTSGNAKNVLYAAAAARTDRKGRRRTSECGGRSYCGTGKGNLSDPGASSSGLPYLVSDAGREILCGVRGRAERKGILPINRK